MGGVEFAQEVESTVKQTRASGIATSSGVWSGGFLFITGEGALMVTEGSGQVYDPIGAQKVGRILQWPNFLVDLDEELEEDPHAILHLALNCVGNSVYVEVSSSGWEISDLRKRIYLGTAMFSGGELIAVENKRSYVRTSATQMEALSDSLKTFVVEGLQFESKSRLSFGITPGAAYRTSINFQDELDPNRLRTSKGMPAPFVTYVWRDGSGGWSAASKPENEMDPRHWDDGSGELKPVPDNRYTLQQVYLDVRTGNVVIQYGQELLANRDKVANALVFSEWIPYESPDLIRRAIVSVKGSAVTLQDRRKCIISHCGRFGSLGG